MGDRHGMQLCGFTYARELHGNQMEHKPQKLCQCVRTTDTVHHNIREERPGNTGPCPQNNEDYDAI